MKKLRIGFGFPPTKKLRIHRHPIALDAACPGRSGTTGQPVSILAQAQRAAGCHTSALSDPGVMESIAGIPHRKGRSASIAGSAHRPTPCRSGLAERRLPVQAAPRDWRNAPGWRDPSSFPAAAAPPAQSDRVSVDARFPKWIRCCPPGCLLGSALADPGVALAALWYTRGT